MDEAQCSQPTDAERDVKQEARRTTGTSQFAGLGTLTHPSRTQHRQAATLQRLDPGGRQQRQGRVRGGCVVAFPVVQWREEVEGERKNGSEEGKGGIGEAAGVHGVEEQRDHHGRTPLPRRLRLEPVLGTGWASKREAPFLSARSTYEAARPGSPIRSHIRASSQTIDH